MARVRLYLRSASGNPVFRFTRPDGTPDAIPALWLFTYVDTAAHVRLGNRLAAQAAHSDCIVDTGSPLTVIPEYVWSYFKPGVVTPLPFDPSMPQRHRSTSFGSSRYPYELGELAIRLRDLDRNAMDLRIVAQLTRDGGALTAPVVLGPRGGAIDGRVQHAESDSVAPFGQVWSLADP